LEILLKPIGTIRTPYTNEAPYQPEPDAQGSFYIELDTGLEDGLFKLESFKYIYLLFYLHRQDKSFHTHVTPPWAGGKKVGLFASRSPCRPNPIGLSVVKIKRIEKNVVHISGIDALDGTPLLDIKPYSLDLDAKIDANDGWRSEELSKVPHGRGDL
jgi:tRNA-Thr(GGU) m(6)t(6)A37 methyltransferase TsaA